MHEVTKTKSEKNTENYVINLTPAPNAISRLLIQEKINSYLALASILKLFFWETFFFIRFLLQGPVLYNTLRP